MQQGRDTAMKGCLSAHVASVPRSLLSRKSLMDISEQGAFAHEEVLNDGARRESRQEVQRAANAEDR